MFLFGTQKYISDKGSKGDKAGLDAKLMKIKVLNAGCVDGKWTKMRRAKGKFIATKEAFEHPKCPKGCPATDIFAMAIASCKKNESGACLPNRPVRISVCIHCIVFNYY